MDKTKFLFPKWIAKGSCPLSREVAHFINRQGFLKATSGRSVIALVPWGTALEHYPKGECWEGETLLKTEQKLLE